MEGGFMPGFYRAKIINEVRSTHFNLGKSPNEFLTTNAKNFKGLISEKIEPVTHKNESSVQITMNSNKKDLSEFSAKYRSYSEEPRVKANKPSPTLHLSQSPGDYVTTNSKAYKKIENKERVEFKGYSMQKQRKHNFDLGTEEDFTYSTAMQHDFTYIKPEPSVSYKEIKEKYKGTVAFNEKKGDYMSTNQKEFQNRKPATPVKGKKLDKASFQLQNESQALVSMNQLAYYSKKPENAALSTSKLEQLKSSHITLGNAQENYTLSSKQPHFPSETEKAGSYSPTRIKFGIDNNTYASNYSMNYSVRPRSSLEKSLKSIKKYQNHSDIRLGEENSGLISQSHLVHKNLPGIPGKLPYETEKNLKSNHFSLGFDGKFYNTTAQNYGKGKSENKNYVSERSYKMKISNWAFGNYPTQMKTDFKREYE